MFRNKDSNNESNFWISYADLMAGLLFVFILLIGAIVSKSMILREDLHKKEDKLASTETSLAQKRERLHLTEMKLKSLIDELKKREDVLRDVNSSLAKNVTKVATQKEKIFKDKSLIANQRHTIVLQGKKITLQATEVAKLHRLLADLKTTFTQQSKELKVTQGMVASQVKLSKSQALRVADLQSLITLTKDSLKLKERELEKLNQLLLARNSKVDTLSKKVVLLQNITNETNTTLAQREKKIQEYEGRVLVLSNSLTDKEDQLALNQQKLATLLDGLDKKRTKYDDLIAKLQSQKAQIKSLTGIKLKVIAALKNTLGDKINIDRKSGALKLASNILFDHGSSDLKSIAKVELKTSFEEYIVALVTDQAIAPHLDRIMIEGHTDSDGGYLYNVELSQKRALAVMNYLLSLSIAEKYDLKKYLLASGRSYQDRIFGADGKENKEASRRIVIKFQLKNQDAMHEIERILDDGR